MHITSLPKVSTIAITLSLFSSNFHNVPRYGKIKVYIRKLFKLKNNRKKEERQCTLKGQTQYANVWGSVHWKGVYRVGDRDLGVQNL